MVDRQPRLAARQRGASLLGFTFQLVILGFCALVAVKVAPIYYEHFRIVNSLQSLRLDGNLSSSSPEEIMQRLEKRWDINSVTRVNRKNVTITNTGRGTRVEVAYDATENIVANADVVVHFKESVEVSSR